MKTIVKYLLYKDCKNKRFFPSNKRTAIMQKCRQWNCKIARPQKTLKCPLCSFSRTAWAVNSFPPHFTRLEISLPFYSLIFFKSAAVLLIVLFYLSPAKVTAAESRNNGLFSTIIEAILMLKVLIEMANFIKSKRPPALLFIPVHYI